MIEKKFSKSFDEVLEQAYRFHTEFLTDQATFIAATPLFNVPFAADFLTDIEAADALPTYEDDRDDLILFTQEVDAKMEEAREHFQKLMYYVNIAWPDNNGIARGFGSSQYDKARKSTLRLINLIQKAFIKANSTTYKLDLIAAGFVQADIDLLHTLADGITEKNNAQEEYMSNTYERSEARTVAFNKVWDSMVKISDGSKIIFKDSPAKVEFYLLYTTTHHALAKPQNLTAVLDAVDPLKVNIDFDPVPDALEYHLFRSLVTVGDPSGTFTDIGTSATNHFDAPLTTGKRNYWKVKAYNDTQPSSAYSDEVWLDA